MLHLATESAAEAMNFFTDWHHPLHTYNNHNRFRQFGFTQQNIIVNTDDVERDIEISNGKGSWRHWCFCRSRCFSVISIFWWQVNFLILQYKQTYLFLSYFSPPATIQTNSTLAWEFVQKYLHGWTRIMKPFCHFAIDSLNRSLLEQSAAIIASLN